VIFLVTVHVCADMYVTVLQVFPPTLQCGAMLLNVILRQLVLCLHPKPADSIKEESQVALEEGEGDGTEPEEASRHTSSLSSSCNVSVQDSSKELDVSVLGGVVGGCDYFGLRGVC